MRSVEITSEREFDLAARFFYTLNSFPDMTENFHFSYLQDPTFFYPPCQ